MNLPGERIPNFGTVTQKAVFWVTAHLITDGRGYWNKAPEDDWSSQVGSYESRQSFRYAGFHPCSVQRSTPTPWIGPRGKLGTNVGGTRLEWYGLYNPHQTLTVAIFSCNERISLFAMLWPFSGCYHGIHFLNNCKVQDSFIYFRTGAALVFPCISQGE